ncbi:MAG TPA: hypothetical protein VIL22_03175 [Paenibacillaceae bacterium]
MPNDRRTRISAAAFLIVTAAAILFWYHHPSRTSCSVAENQIPIRLLQAEKQPDESVLVTAEVTNHSACTLALTSLGVASVAIEEETSWSENGSTGSSVRVRPGNPPELPIRILEGTLDPLPPGEPVRFAFTVPAEYDRENEQLYVNFRFMKVRYKNREETQPFLVTERLEIPG